MEEQELYEQKRKAQLEEWQAEVDRLKAKAEKAGADAQIRLQRRLEDLERKLDGGRTKLASLAEAGHEKWDAARERIDHALEAIQVGVGEARDELEKTD